MSDTLVAAELFDSSTKGVVLELVVAESCMILPIYAAEDATLMMTSNPMAAVTMIFAVFVQLQVLFHIKTSPTGQKNSRNSTMTHVLPYHGPPAGAPPTG